MWVKLVGLSFLNLDLVVAVYFKDHQALITLLGCGTRTMTGPADLAVLVAALRAIAANGGPVPSSVLSVFGESGVPQDE